MFTSELKSKIDRVWDAFHSGGLSNPLSVIEQITYLLFLKMLDEQQTKKEEDALLFENEIQNPIYVDSEKHLRWKNFKNLSPEEMYELFRKENGVFDFMKNYGGKSKAFSKFMKNASFMIPTPRLLVQVVDMLDDIVMKDTDTKGDVYEYMLSKIATAGQNGQFRTPRHITKMMVELMKPTPEDIICDPSAGSCGFLVSSLEYVQEHYANELTQPQVQEHYNNQMFMGMEFDPTMIRIGAMNLISHGIANPRLIDVDSLSQHNADFDNQASLILANPPFKGSLDKESVDDSILKIVDTKQTELLFLALMIRGLKIGGRCAVIIPDGVLFGSQKAHKMIRKEIIENHNLEAVISMPSGVFQPYAGVSTAILIFTKTGAGGTDQVWFYDMKADGYSLDKKRNAIDQNDIPDIIARYHNREAETQRTRTEQSFLVPKEEIVNNAYDLSISRYKEVIYEQKNYEKPENIIANIQKLDQERQQLIKELALLMGNG